MSIYTKQDFKNGQVLNASNLIKMEIGIQEAELQKQENTISILTIPAGETEGIVEFALSRGAGPYGAIIPVDQKAAEAFVSGDPYVLIQSINFIPGGLSTQIRTTFAGPIESLPWQEDLTVENYDSAAGRFKITITPQENDVSYICIGAKTGSAEHFLGGFLIGQKNQNQVGESVTGESFVVNEETLVAGNGAEIFNNYALNIATGAYSHAEGSVSKAIGDSSHAEGAGTIASGLGAHSEGQGTTASKDGAHAEGLGTVASSSATHAEGTSTEATQQSAHAEGIQTKAYGLASHAEGLQSQALEAYSHAEGQGTIAASSNQHVEGKWNLEDYEERYAHIVGNGSQDAQRSNAYVLDWNGNAQYSGTVESAGLVLTSVSGYKFLITVEDDGTVISSPISE